MKRIVYFFLIFSIFTACSKSENATSTATPPAEQKEQPSQKSTEPQATIQDKADQPMDSTVAEEIENDMSKAHFGPMEAIKDLDKEIEGYRLGQNLTSEELEANRNLKQRIIRGTFDIKELCRLALDKHWEPLLADQKKHFVDLMTQLLEKKAIFSKEQLQGENKLYQINYIKEVIDQADPAKATVYSRMVIPKRKMDLELTYKLIKKPNGWKIYDVIVDDAELLKNYRYQFDRIIQKGGYGDLVKRMEQKLGSIGAKSEA